MARTISDYAGDAAARNEQPASRWGWFVALGIVLLVLSFFAFGNLLMATMATVYFIGILMLIGGAAQLAQAFQVRRWGSFFLWLLAGVLYAVAGIVAIIEPRLTAAALTLLLAIALAVSGILRLWWGFTLRAVKGRGWIIASGIVSVVAGIVFYAAWPWNAPWLLGLVLAIDLALQGILMLSFGLGLRSVQR